MKYFREFILLSMPLVGMAYIFHLPSRLNIPISRENYLGVFLALALASSYLEGAQSNKQIERIFNIVMLCLSLVCGGFIAISFPAILLTMGQSPVETVVLGAVTIILILEATRRHKAGVLLWVIIIFILYARYAHLLPGLLYTREISWSRILSYLYLDTNAILGVPVVVSSSILLSFLFFGQCLVKLGGAEVLTQFAYALMGNHRGGPGKVAIIASAMFGSVSGSAVSNVTTTGIVTIPMMIKIGFKRHVAPAIEAVASTGGLVTPPVMGAVAFLISQLLEIPYSDVVIAAFIPAVLFYTYLLLYVDLEAARSGLKGLPKDELPRLRDVMRKGFPFFGTMLLLIYLLIVKSWDPSLSALVSSGLILIIAGIQKKLSWKSFGEILRGTTRAVSMVGILCAAAGIIMGIISLSGLGTKISQILIDISGHHVYLLLSLSAITCIFLGMGMPATPAYLLLVLLIAPAVVQLGINPLSAHLFIFYFGAVSFVTPPVCLAVYAAASIAESNIWKTAVTAMKLAVPFYILPFVFVREPSFLFEGSVYHITVIFASAFFGVGAVASGMAGYLLSKLGVLERALLVVSGICLSIPTLGTDYVGAVMLAVVLAWQIIKRIGR